MNKAAASNDTIVAIATPPGRGGIGVLRVSGPQVADIARGVLGDLPSPRYAALRIFKDAQAEMIDGGLALYFPAPASFTGEDVLELQGHGGPVVMDLLLARVLELGARAAEPGEFSQRAFLNDKLDLTQAEAIADLIDSGSAQAARAATRSLQGEFSQAVRELTEAVTETRIHVEAAIDFPEEEVDFLADAELRERIDATIELCAELVAQARQGTLLREGMTVVIAGRPNAGKSSLLNRLAGYEAAIVTDIPGTTRDILRERIHIDGMPLHVADTAGLRDEVDVIEAEGIRRARQEMSRADRILYLIDASRGLSDAAIAQELAALPPEVPVSIVMNKVDLCGSLEEAMSASTAHPHASSTAMSPAAPGTAISNELIGAVAKETSAAKDSTVAALPPCIRLSAITGQGIDELRDHLKACMGYLGAEAGTISARRRHLDALGRAEQHLQQALHQLLDQKAGELMAEELRQAQQCLAEITGEFTSEDLLGRIFSSFCIGK